MRVNRVLDFNTIIMAIHVYVFIKLYSRLKSLAVGTETNSQDGQLKTYAVAERLIYSMLQWDTFGPLDGSINVHQVCLGVVQCKEGSG
jgi:hypothetical protein